MQIPEHETWDDRLLGLVETLAATGNVPFPIAAHFKGVLCVARLGLGVPGVVEALRCAMRELAVVPELKEYMDETVKRFETDILIGTIIVEVLTNKSNSGGA